VQGLERGVDGDEPSERPEVVDGPDAHVGQAVLAARYAEGVGAESDQQHDEATVPRSFRTPPGTGWVILTGARPDERAPALASAVAFWAGHRLRSPARSAACETGTSYGRPVTAADHPLQAALDRSSRALLTATDLVEIAQTRKSAGGRSDARQASLYRAIVAASVGVVEEATEALVTEALRAQGLQSRAMAIIESTIARLMQNPNSAEIRKVMEAFVGFDPTPCLALRLRTSAPAYRNAEAVGARTSHNLWTIYNEERDWKGSDAAEVLDRFVRIRHSFAHQDSSVVLFSKSEVTLLRTTLGARKAVGPVEVGAVERLNATCATRVFTPSSGSQDPVRDWRLHETHALNALLMTAGVVASMADGLADHLASTAGHPRSKYAPLALAVEEGAWLELAGAGLTVSPCGVPWTFTKYAPLSRR
jgi:hypothetical protein